MEIIYQGKIENVECVDEFGFDKIELLLEAMDLSTEYDDEGVGRYVLNRQEYKRLKCFLSDCTCLYRLKKTKRFKTLSFGEKNDFASITYLNDLAPDAEIGAQLAWLRRHGIV